MLGPDLAPPPFPSPSSRVKARRADQGGGGGGGGGDDSDSRQGLLLYTLLPKEDGPNEASEVDGPELVPGR